MSRRSFLRSSAITLAATALVAAPIAAPAFAASPQTDPAPLNGYRSVGYVMAESPVTRDFQIEDIIGTGAIADVTHINYAFGNVTTDLVCDIPNPDTAAPGYDPSNPDAGDAANDYLRLVSAEDSVDGVADTAGQAIAGNFNQLRKLKAAYPDTKVLISLGGWTWSDNFSAAAATAESRERLVTSCIDLYLDGNLPTYGDKGGAGAAAGIFDGIDIDWEWPVTGGETANATPEDKENFLALMEEFRAQLDERGAADDEQYLLTAFAPVGGWNTSGGWRDARLFEVIDWLNVQGYDYHGGWVPNSTGHQGNLFPDGTNNWGLALAPELQAYISAGARPDQLNAGLAAYGHGWAGVENGTEGWQSAESYIGTKPYFELRDLGDTYFDEETGAAWKYDDATDDWWSLDTTASVKAKAEHVASAGYGGVMWWDLSGDHRNELGAAAGDTFRAAVVGPLAAPTITGGQLNDAVEGANLAFTPAVSGRGPLSFAIVDGELPAGLALDPTAGTIGGTAPAPGSYTFQVQASNAFGPGSPARFVLVVTEAPVAPVDPVDPIDPVAPADPGAGTGAGAGAGTADPSVPTAGQSGADDLAHTGFGANGLIGWALGLLGLGGVVLLLKRNRAELST